MRTGRADLPLHGGRAPRRLFERMTSLAEAMTLVIVEEHGVAGSKVERSEKRAALTRLARLPART